MDAERKVFSPPRGRGLLVNIGLTFTLGLLAAALVVLATRTSLGPLFLVYILGALFILAPTPLLVYRLYGLLAARFVIDRDSLSLKWGYRKVDIPLLEIEYLEYAEDLLFPLLFPRLTWPGAVVGINEQDKLGTVEFMASEKVGLVMIGTPERVYVISPDDAHTFVTAYRELSELGSLTPTAAKSTAPSFALLDIWRAPLTRSLLIITVAFSLALFVLVGWSIPTLEQVSLGFDPIGQPREPVSPGQLLLLPVLNILFVVANAIISMIYHRRLSNRLMVNVLWGANVLSSFLFLLAVLFILRIS